MKLESTEIKNFDPSLISKGQEMIFTLKDINALDEGDNNLNINENLQIDEVKYDKDTGISIEKYDETSVWKIKQKIIN